MPRDLVELFTRSRRVTLRTTEDNSTTRLRVQVRAVDWEHTCLSAELNVRDVQQLAGAMLQWLNDGGHALPDAPAGWVLVEQYLEDEPAVHVIPEHSRGQ